MITIIKISIRTSQVNLKSAACHPHLAAASSSRAHHQKEMTVLQGQIDVLLKERDELLQKVKAVSGQASSKCVRKGGGTSVL